MTKYCQISWNRHAIDTISTMIVSSRIYFTFVFLPKENKYVNIKDFIELPCMVNKFNSVFYDLFGLDATIFLRHRGLCRSMNEWRSNLKWKINQRKEDFNLYPTFEINLSPSNITLNSSILPKCNRFNRSSIFLMGFPNSITNRESFAKLDWTDWTSFVAISYQYQFPFDFQFDPVHIRNRVLFVLIFRSSVHVFLMLCSIIHVCGLLFQWNRFGP